MGSVGDGRYDHKAPPRLHEFAEQTKAKIDANYTQSFSGLKIREKELPVLPPNVSRSTFNKAIAELRKGLGQEWVELNDKPLNDGWYLDHPKMHDMMAIVDHDYFIASAIVWPSSTEEVQLIVRWANKYKIPIYPFSIGRNLGYGGSAPRLRGSVVIDLGRRMNKVLDLDDDSCFALVEPGVTYFGLYEEIHRQGKKLWIDVPDLGGGSVLGNSMDRGVGYTPYGDHFGMHCGMEVVLPNGEVMRTGMGALPGNNTWQLFQYGYGPYCDGIFSQSNYGICTKMGVWLMPPPEGYQVFLFTFPREEDLHQLVEIIRPLRIANVIANVPHVRHALEECAVQGTRREWCPEVVGAVPDDVLEKMTEKLWMGKCRWLYYGCVYGPEAFRKAQLEAIKDAFFQIKGAKLFFPEDSPPNSYLRSRVNIYTGTPDLRELDWVNWRTNGGHIAFSPVSPVRGEDAVKQFALCKKICDKYGFDFLSTYCVGMREMHHIAEIIFDKGDPDGKRKVLACCRELIAEAAKLGYGEYRTHLILQDQVAATYNWNNNILMKFNETLKDALDPQGILSPGRNGIWPKSYRGKGYEFLPNGEKDQVASAKSFTKEKTNSRF